MTELYRHIGEYTDVPAGDIGVGGREIGYLFGQYKRITNRYESGVLTGKGIDLGRLAGAHRGHRLRHRLLRRGDPASRGRVLRRQAGRRLRLRQRGDLRHREGARSSAAPVVACSDSSGYVVDEKGIDLDLLKEIKEVEPRPDQRVRRAARATSAFVRHGLGVGGGRATSRCPCATQNELDERPRHDARSRTAARSSPRAPTCPRRPRPSSCSPRPGWSSRRARPPTPAAWRPARSRCSRTPRATRGLRAHRGAARRRSCAASTTAACETADEYGAAGQLRRRREHRRLHPGRRRDAGARRHLARRPRSAAG